MNSTVMAIYLPVITGDFYGIIPIIHSINGVFYKCHYFSCECPPLFTLAPWFTWAPAAGHFRGRAGRRMAAGLCPAMPMASFGALDPDR